MLYGIDDRSEKIAHPMNRDRGLPWGRPGNKKPPPETGDGHFSPVGVRRLELPAPTSRT